MGNIDTLLLNNNNNTKNNPWTPKSEYRCPGKNWTLNQTTQTVEKSYLFNLFRHWKTANTAVNSLYKIL